MSYLLIAEPCTTNGAACQPNGECVNSILAVDGWFCSCFDGYIADTNNDKHVCIAGKRLIEADMNSTTGDGNHIFSSESSSKTGC